MPVILSDPVPKIFDELSEGVFDLRPLTELHQQTAKPLSESLFTDTLPLMAS